MIPDCSPWIGLARPGCSYCSGSALLESGITCYCVLRRVARAVCSEVRFLESRSLIRSSCPNGTVHAQGRRISGSRYSEYCCDVHLVAKRTLSAADFLLWQRHCLEETPWSACDTGLTHVGFFQRLYRIEATLGKVFLELKPYALYPPGDYFRTRLERAQPCIVPEVPVRKDSGPLRPPLAPKPPAPPVQIRMVSQEVLAARKKRQPAVPDINDPVAVARFARACLREGSGLRSITERLRSLGLPIKRRELKKMLLAA